MRLWLILGILLSASSLAENNLKWATNKSCEGCHSDISHAWDTSRHSNSHYSKNDLFKKSLDYMARKNPRNILIDLKVKCAKCHNPKLLKEGVTKEEKVLLLFGHKDTEKSFHNILDNDTMKNGINCMVCHNIDNIHRKDTQDSAGMKSVTFGPKDVMFGPFDNAQSIYHKTKYRPHFDGNDPKLCFVCHYGAKNDNGVQVYETGKEYKEFAQGDEGCKDCHMSKKYAGFASNYPMENGKPKQRMVRKHRFASVDNSNILYEYIDIKGYTEGDNFVVTLNNHAPHKVPTGYGLRELILKVNFLDKDDGILGKKKFVLGTKWIDGNNEETIPHLATNITSDTRLNGKSKQAYNFAIPKNAVYVKYSFSYRLVSERLARKIGITDPFFLREYIFSEQRLHL